jgi:hypothetical protein
MTPCPCGYLGDPRHARKCSATEQRMVRSEGMGDRDLKGVDN